VRIERAITQFNSAPTTAPVLKRREEREERKEGRSELVHLSAAETVRTVSAILLTPA